MRMHPVVLQGRIGGQREDGARTSVDSVGGRLAVYLGLLVLLGLVGSDKFV